MHKIEWTGKKFVTKYLNIKIVWILKSLLITSPSNTFDQQSNLSHVSIFQGKMLPDHTG